MGVWVIWGRVRFFIPCEMAHAWCDRHLPPMSGGGTNAIPPPATGTRGNRHISVDDGCSGSGRLVPSRAQATFRHAEPSRTARRRSLRGGLQGLGRQLTGGSRRLLPPRTRYYRVCCSRSGARRVDRPAALVNPQVGEACVCRLRSASPLNCSKLGSFVRGIATMAHGLQ